MHLRKKIFSFFVLINFLQLSGQFKLPELITESGTLLFNGESAPFWTVSNKYGIYDVKNNCIYTRAILNSSIDSIKKFDYFYGIDAIGMLNNKATPFIEQAFAGIKIYKFNLWGGMRNYHVGPQDSTLSLGGFIYSGNARPIPRIEFSSSDYFLLPYTFGLIELKGGLSHGWLGNTDQYVKGAYIHDKYAYVRIKIHRNFKIFAGIHHVVEWGGTSPVDSYGKLPSSFRDYWRVFFAESGGDGSPESEIINKLGNHIASYQGGIRYENKNYLLEWYWLTMLEDKNGRVGVDWKNSQDGLWGISFTNKNSNGILQKAVLEFFNSENQSGDIHKSGGDDYYNNGIYESGWTNYKMVIGTPVITSPAFYNGNPIFVTNNRVRAFHTGLILQKNQFNILAKLTYTRNYGRARIPFPSILNQFYGALEIKYRPKKMKNATFSCLIGLDKGDWLGNNFGSLLTFTKSFKL
jgi:hypothetical protein